MCLDFRPINAVEGRGLHELVAASVQIGKKYPNMKMEDFFQRFPSRYVTKSVIHDVATSAKETIKVLFAESIKQSGLGCTLDLWSDDFKSNSYMAMTANLLLLREDCIQQKPLVFHMGLVPDTVKSKTVIKDRVVDVFKDFGVGQQELKANVVFTTDR